MAQIQIISSPCGCSFQANAGREWLLKSPCSPWVHQNFKHQYDAAHDAMNAAGLGVPVSQTQEVMGYRVELTGDYNAPYLLHGKRGAQYGLIRFPKAPHQFWVMNARTGNTDASIKGNTRFTDKDGDLRPIS